MLKDKYVNLFIFIEFFTFLFCNFVCIIILDYKFNNDFNFFAYSFFCGSLLYTISYIISCYIALSDMKANIIKSTNKIIKSLFYRYFLLIVIFVFILKYFTICYTIFFISFFVKILLQIVSTIFINVFTIEKV